jgi:hypothetical protein
MKYGRRFKDGKALATSDKTLLKNGNYRIPKVRSTDAGLYSCEAKNNRDTKGRCHD